MKAVRVIDYPDGLDGYGVLSWMDGRHALHLLFMTLIHREIEDRAEQSAEWITETHEIIDSARQGVKNQIRDQAKEHEKP